MKYYVKRDLNEYGPYTLTDLQRYVAQGNIVMTDLARSEGMTDWVPVSQVLGNIPVPAPAAAMPPAGAGTVYAGPQPGGQVYAGAAPVAAYGAPAPAAGPVPPDFHWALVLLIYFFTCGLFGTVWLFVEAAFVKKIVPESKGLMMLIISIGGIFVLQFVNVGLTMGSRGEPNEGVALLVGLLILACAILSLVGVFTLRSDLETYYNSTENIGLHLSGVMTFFFSVFYFQYHFSRIAKWKKTGVLEA